MRRLRVLVFLAWTGTLAVCGWAADPMPDFRLVDINPNSPRTGTGVSPRDYVLQVSVFYFASLDCAYCRTQYGHLETVLREVTEARPGLRVEMVAVNHAGDGTRPDAGAPASGTIPWIQDTAEAGAWDRWQVEWRDLVILDPFNRPVARDNLTDHDLSAPHRREGLRDALVSLATPVDSDGDGLPDVWEIYWSGGLDLTADGDPDGDGADNLTEFVMGTNPMDPASRPRVAVDANRSGTEPLVWVGFRRFSGRVPLVIETSTDWTVWTRIETAWAEGIGYRNLYDGTGSATLQFPLPSSGTEPVGFVRVRAVREPSLSSPGIPGDRRSFRPPR